MARLAGKQILLVVGQRNYNNQEFDYLNDFFAREGAVVSVASPKPEKAVGRLEGYVIPHLTIAEANAADYDAIVLIGGYGAYTYLWDDPDVHQLLQKANSLHKIVVGASVAAVALANAGILADKKATVYPDYNGAVILGEKGANHVYENVVVDDNIITSNHPKKVEELGEVITEKLIG